MNLHNLRAQLAIEEGSRLAAYLDTERILTIGIGHNCEAKPVAGVARVGDLITSEQEGELFAADIAEVCEQLDRHLPWWRGLDDVRQNVIANMCFNMGLGRPGKDGLRSFVNTLAAVERGDYDDAAQRMLESKWARQVGCRAWRLSNMMRTGKWPADIPGMA